MRHFIQKKRSMLNLRFRVIAIFCAVSHLCCQGVWADPETAAEDSFKSTAIGTMPESEPLASWINTYNVLVIDAVLQRYPLSSVIDVPDFFSKIKYPGMPVASVDTHKWTISPRGFALAGATSEIRCAAYAVARWGF
jgi:hypothetical protein